MSSWVLRLIHQLSSCSVLACRGVDDRHLLPLKAEPENDVQQMGGILFDVMLH